MEIRMRSHTSLILVWIALLAACTTNSTPPLPRASMPDWSPDSQQIVYVCFEDGPTVSESFEDGPFPWMPFVNRREWLRYSDEAGEICVMNRDGANKRRLLQNKNADTDPAWSPDGKAIAFASHDGLYLIDLMGGAPRRLFEGRYVSDPNWSPDSLQIAFVACRNDRLGNGSDIYIVNKDGQLLTTLDNSRGETLVNPRWSPNGVRLVYSSTPDPTCISVSTNKVHSLMLLNLQDVSSSIKVAADLIDVRQIMWIDNETLAYSVRSDNGFVLHSIDLETGLATKITPDEVLDGIHYAWAPDKNSLAYTTSDDAIYIEDRLSGQTTLVWRQTGAILDLNWSPDGKQLLVYISEEVPRRLNSMYTETIWVIGRDGKFAKRLTPLLPSDPGQ